MSSVGKIGSNAYDIGKNYFLSQSALNSEMSKYIPKQLKTLQQIDKYSGEAFNIGINALGTAAVAPIFIAYNPLSKTDEETKKYSALRQPISAVLTVITQAGLVIPWNRLLDNWNNNGKSGQFYDKRGFQDKSYLMRQAKKANPTKSKKELEAIVKAQQADQYGRLYADFIEKGTLNIGGKPISEEQMREIINDACKDKIKKGQETLERYKFNGEKYNNKINRVIYLYQNKDIVLEKMAKIQTDIASMNEKEIGQYIKKTIKEAKASGTDKELINIYEIDLKPKVDKSSLTKQIEHIIERTNAYSKYPNEMSLKQSIHDSLVKSKAATEKQIAHFQEIQKLAQEKGSFEKIMKLIKMEKLRDSQLGDIELENIRVGVIDKYIDKLSKRIKGQKAITGLVVSLAIMPFTCCALNYLYPRFMDKFFPHLSKAKKEGGKKCQ